MKKILVSLMLLVMTALSAHAQFEKEVWYVNASLTGLAYLIEQVMRVQILVSL